MIRRRILQKLTIFFGVRHLLIRVARLPLTAISCCCSVCRAIRRHPKEVAIACVFLFAFSVLASIVSYTLMSLPYKCEGRRGALDPIAAPFKLDQPVQYQKHDKFYQCDENRPLPTDKYVVISATTPSADAARCARGNAECSFAFYLPLTALAWRRIGYSTIVLIAGDDKPWRTPCSHLNHVYRNLLDIENVTVIFLPCGDDMKTAVALIGRLFVADMEPFVNNTNAYLVTSDADLFPIVNYYDLLLPNNDVRVTNPKCCGTFNHKEGFSIDMAATANIGMRVSTWHLLMQYRTLSNNSNIIARIQEAVVNEFGQFPYNVTRGQNPEWFLDQEMVSYYFYMWRRRFNLLDCRRSRYDGTLLRWEQSGWPTYLREEEWLAAHDAHCPMPGHTWDSFRYLQPLAQYLAGDKFDVVVYWHKFVSLIGDSTTTGSIPFVATARLLITTQPREWAKALSLYKTSI